MGGYAFGLRTRPMRIRRFHNVGTGVCQASRFGENKKSGIAAAPCISIIS